MDGLGRVFEELNRLKEDGVFEEYAVAGGIGFLFYLEAVRTFDLDVFVFLPAQAGLIISMKAIYDALASRGFQVQGDHIAIHGIPVQFFPSYNELADEAVEEAIQHDYVGVSVRVARPEHLVALAWQTGGAARRERAASLEALGTMDDERLTEIMRRHGVTRP